MNSAVEKDVLIYRMNENGPSILKNILQKRGWIPFVAGESLYWNLSWKGEIYLALKIRKSLSIFRV